MLHFVRVCIALKSDQRIYQSVQILCYMTPFLLVACGIVVPSPTGPDLSRGPMAGFVARPRESTYPVRVGFTDTSLAMSSPNWIQWYWEFGDGETSTLQNPDHLYVEAGKYSVSLVVRTSIGSDTTSMINHISIVHPFADSWSVKSASPFYGAAFGTVLNGELFIVRENGLLVDIGAPYEFPMYVYNPSTDSFPIVTTLRISTRIIEAVAAIEDKVYVLDSDENLTAFDPSTYSWISKAKTDTSRASVAAEVIDGQLYVAGGYNRDENNQLRPLSIIQVYDPSTDSWTTLQSMPTERFGAAACDIDGKLYIIGGQFEWSGGYLATLEVYDPATDSWVTKAPMPTARSEAAVGVINGLLYVVGGESELSDPYGLERVEVYNPETNSWSNKSPMPVGRRSHAIGVINGVMYVACGYYTSTDIEDWRSYHTLAYYP